MTAESISEKERRIREAGKFPTIDEEKARETRLRLFLQGHEQQILWHDGDLSPKTETQQRTDSVVQQTIWQDTEPTHTHKVYRLMIDL